VSATYEPPQSPRRTRPLTAVPSVHLTSSRRAETALEQRNDGSRPHDVPVVTSPRINSPLSPITHFSLPEPFNASTPTGGSPKRQARSIIRHSHQNVESEVHPSGLTFVSALSRPSFSESSCSHAKSSSVPRVSSPLTGSRQLPGFSEPGAGYHRSSLHAEYTGDNSSFSDTETGSLYTSTHGTTTPRVAEQNRTERASGATTQAWIGASSHESKPHTRSAPRAPSGHVLPIRATALPWSMGQSPANVEEVADDWFVTVFEAVPCIDHSLATLHQRRSVSIVIVRPNVLVAPQLNAAAMLSSLECPDQQYRDPLRTRQPDPHTSLRATSWRISSRLAHPWSSCLLASTAASF
jgi:hypothetical protein